MHAQHDGNILSLALCKRHSAVVVSTTVFFPFSNTATFTFAEWHHLWCHEASFMMPWVTHSKDFWYNYRRAVRPCIYALLVLLLLACAKSHRLSASWRQPHLLHVSAVDRRQTWSMDKSWRCVRLLVPHVYEPYVQLVHSGLKLMTSVCQLFVITVLVVWCGIVEFNVPLDTV